MNIFSRLSDIISANINALLDKAENPEKMIGQIIREMEDGLASAKRYAATAIAAERRISRELDQNRTEAVHWKAKALEALSADREDLARRALVRKNEHEELVKGLEAQHALAVQTSENVKTSLRALEARLAEAHRKQRSLLARHRAAKVRVELHKVARVGIPDPGTAFAKFDRLENRITDFEDEVAALSEINFTHGHLDAEFAELEGSQQIDEELQALKKEAERKIEDRR